MLALRRAQYDAGSGALNAMDLLRVFQLPAPARRCLNEEGEASEDQFFRCAGDYSLRDRGDASGGRQRARHQGLSRGSLR